MGYANQNGFAFLMHVPGLTVNDFTHIIKQAFIKW